MTEPNYGAVRTADQFEKFVDRLLSDGKPIGFDIEAGYSGPDIEDGALLQFHPNWFMVGFSFTNSRTWARYVPIAHDDDGNADDIIRIARALWRMLQSGLGVAHNLSYELKGLSRWFMETLKDDDSPEADQVRDQLGFFPFRSDTMIEAFFVARYKPKGPMGGPGIGLKELVEFIYGHKMVHFDDLFPPEDSDMGPGHTSRSKKSKRFNTRNSRSKAVIEYACEDALWCLELHELHYPMDEIQSGKHTLWQIEMMLLPVLVEMEREAMLLDWDLITAKAKETAEFKDLMNEEILVKLSERLHRNININIGSTQQLAKILFDPPPEGLGIPVKLRSDKTGAPSTSEEALRAVAKADPMIDAILKWREVGKLYGSYLHKYEVELNYAGNGRAYPNHNQVGALTGRFSVDGVSYQQWPKPYHYELDTGRTFDLNFRDLLIAPEGFRIMGWDYSQVELRVLAGMANETSLLEAFAANEDIHKATAANMFGIPISEVTKKIRAQGKTLNFAVVYGSGPGNIAELLDTPDAPVTKEDAEGLLEKYFEAFPKLKGWMDQKVAEGRESKAVYTAFGRRFSVWEYTDPRDFIRSKGDRMCVNAPVQGGAADYIKIAMVRAQKAIKKAGMQDKIRLIMTIHDSLVFYVANDVDSQDVIDLVNPAVSFDASQYIPMLPEIRTDWFEGHKWGTAPDIELDDNKRIVGYSHTIELPDKSEMHWTGPTVEDVLGQIEAWRAEYYAELDAKQAALKGSGAKLREIAKPLTAAQKRKLEAEKKAAAEADPELADIEKWHSFPDGPLSPEGEAAKKNLRASLVDDELDLDALVTDDVTKMAESLAEDPPWLHGKEWHEEHGTTSMAFEPMKATVTLVEMPTEAQWDRFDKFLSLHKGDDTVVIETPEGELELDTKHRLTKDHAPEISLMLGGATLVVAPENVDTDAIMEDVEL